MPLLRIASCQFPVTGNIARNAGYICRFLRKAAPPRRPAKPPSVKSELITR